MRAKKEILTSNIQTLVEGDLWLKRKTDISCQHKVLITCNIKYKLSQSLLTLPYVLCTTMKISPNNHHYHAKFKQNIEFRKIWPQI